MKRIPVLTATSLFVTLLFLATGCPGPDWPKCENDDHCKADKDGNTYKRDLMCVFGQCQECAKNEHCTGGKVCKGYRCVAPAECETDQECSDNKVCQGGKCKIECTSDAVCGYGKSCNNNRCETKIECTQDADCQEGQSCVNNSCQSAGSGGECSIEPRIHFEFNEAAITQESRTVLDNNVDCLKKKPEIRITIEGHCDERGTAEYNLALGERRAASTRKYMQRLGIDSGRIKIISYGEEQPMNNGSNESAWGQNRRAEFKSR